MLNQYRPARPNVPGAGRPHARRAIVERLTRGPASVSEEPAKPLAISFPAVMQHLAVLEGAELVASQKIGRVRICRLEAATLTAPKAWLGNARRAEWQRRFDRLGRYLEHSANGRRRR